MTTPTPAPPPSDSGEGAPTAATDDRRLLSFFRSPLPSRPNSSPTCRKETALNTASAAPPWALFDSFAGTTRPSDFSRSSITGLRPRPSPHDPPLHHDRRVTVRSPGSQHEEITRMHGLSDPAGSAGSSRKRRHRYCLPLIHSTSAPQLCPFRGCKAGLRAPRTQRFAAPSRVANAWTGPPRFARSSM